MCLWTAPLQFKPEKWKSICGETQQPNHSTTTQSSLGNLALQSQLPSQTACRPSLQRGEVVSRWRDEHQHRIGKCLRAARGTGQQGMPGQAAACSHHYSLLHTFISSTSCWLSSALLQQSHEIETACPLLF